MKYQILTGKNADGILEFLSKNEIPVRYNTETDDIEIKSGKVWLPIQSKEDIIRDQIYKQCRYYEGNKPYRVRFKYQQFAQALEALKHPNYKLKVLPMKVKAIPETGIQITSLRDMLDPTHALNLSVFKKRMMRLGKWNMKRLKNGVVWFPLPSTLKTLRKYYTLDGIA